MVAVFIKDHSADNWSYKQISIFPKFSKSCKKYDQVYLFFIEILFTNNKDLENGSVAQILYYQPAGKTEEMIWHGVELFV